MTSAIARPARRLRRSSRTGATPTTCRTTASACTRNTATTQLMNNLMKTFKFVAIFLFTFFDGQIVKNPLEFAIIKSNIINNVPDMVFPFIVALPNVLFYTFIGIILSAIMRKKTFLWALLFCVLELSWKLYFLHQNFFYANTFSGYMLMFFREIVIPFAIGLGIWGQKKYLSSQETHEQAE